MNRYYVYRHKDPITGEILYIGKGCDTRAWTIKRQTQEHTDWLINMYTQYPPQEYSKYLDFPHYHLTEEESINLEEDLIREYKPKFNICVKPIYHTPYGIFKRKMELVNYLFEKQIDTNIYSKSGIILKNKNAYYLFVNQNIDNENITEWYIKNA